MTARSSRRGWMPAVMPTLVGALTLSLLPATAASASVAPPVFSYVATSGAATTPNRSLAVADATGLAPQALTPPGFQVQGFDVSPDGDTTLVAARTGTPTTSPYDSTFGLVLVHRDPATQATTAVLLSVFWEANPVLAANGAKAFWFYRGTLYQYDTTAGGLQPVVTAFAPAAGERVSRLAVSADGTHVAVMYTNLTAGTARVVAAPIATGRTAGNYAEIVYGPAGTQPSSSSFVWRGSDTLIWSEYDSTVSGATTNGVSVTLPSDGSVVRASAPEPTLTGVYDLRQDATGAWWAWQDGASGTTLLAADDATLLGPTAVAPTPAAGPRGDGATTYRYKPSAVPPPALQAVVNPAAAHPELRLSSAVVGYGRRVAYAVRNLYGGIPGLPYAWNRAAEVDRGTLLHSYDGVHWTAVTTTSGAHPFILGSAYYNANYPGVLTRNTWFRWRYAGDAFTASGTSPVRLVRVVPVVTVRVAVSGRYRVVRGTVTRIGGTAVLYRKLSTRWVKVAAAPISSQGVYSFGRRLLPRGTYRVVTLADRYWASGVSAFRI